MVERSERHRHVLGSVEFGPEALTAEVVVSLASTIWKKKLSRCCRFCCFDGRQVSCPTAGGCVVFSLCVRMPIWTAASGR
ncbi:hypothetical protein RSSM_05483 [Rhodopirellula sallentina SM41]|uniref:Uncharacterized protein n=1 Tax=Rhodopirellula sallentina SM41 TaxID=1263870 RepID=M5TV51_9BACT|nr:hypothetical protein RSSM_05483 [Rhodopirellula sallentina SM41]